MHKSKWNLMAMFGSNATKTKSVVFSLCVLIFLPSINHFLNVILQQGFSVTLGFITPVCYIFMAVCSVFVLYKSLFRNKWIILCFLVFWIAVAISYFRYPEIAKTLYTTFVDLIYNPINKVFFFCWPALIGMFFLKDYKAFFYAAVKWSRVSTILGVFAYIYVTLIKGETIQYMSYSYFLLIPFCFCLERAIEGKFLDWMLVLLSGTAILLGGARGTVLAMVIYFLIRIFASSRKISVARILQMVATFGVVIAVLLFYDELLAWGIQLCETFGINSRFLTSLSKESLTTSAGRDAISSAVLNSLSANPFGYGLFGDRYITKLYGYGPSIYSHNIVLEFLCDFGVIGGIALLFLLVWCIMRAMRRNQNSYFQKILWALLPYGILQLFFSSSFLENVLFFALMGLCVQQFEHTSRVDTDEKEREKKRC